MMFGACKRDDHLDCLEVRRYESRLGPVIERCECECHK